jgi:UDP-glucose 4-epimerase
VAKVILITGVGRLLPGRLAGRLAADPSVDRVIGVDDLPPSRSSLDMLGRTEFIRLDIRQRAIAQVIDNMGVDTVIHTAEAANPHGQGSRTRSSDAHVMGTMQLVAACQRAESLRRFVLKSSTACYGVSRRDPAVFTEDMNPVSVPRNGFARDVIDVEGYVSGLGKVRPEIGITILRMAQVIGPFSDTPLTRYFQLPVLPRALGADPRLQLLHESDAVEAMRRAAVDGPDGVFNVAGEGVLLLSQAIRRAGRLRLTVPASLLALAALGRSGVTDLAAVTDGSGNTGRVVDISKLISHFGYRPRYDTAEAFASYLRGRPVEAVLDPAWVRFAETSVARAIGVRPETVGESAPIRFPAPDSRTARGG